MMQIKQFGRANLLLVLAIFFGFGTVLFGALSVVAYSQRTDAVSNLDRHVDTAVAKAVSDQKAQDVESNRKANELPFKTYVANKLDGGFQLQIPKNWSVYAERSSASTQLTLIAALDTVTVNKGGHDTQPLIVQLLDRSSVEVVKSFETKIKAKKLSTRTIKVSGIDSTVIEGVLDEDRHDGIEVVVPVRDKALVFITQSHSFVSEFNQILAKAVIAP